MLGKSNRTAAHEADGGSTPAPEPERSLVTGQSEIDDELQAAIEYKIAVAGTRGADKVLELLNVALMRLQRD